MLEREEKRDIIDIRTQSYQSYVNCIDHKTLGNGDTEQNFKTTEDSCAAIIYIRLENIFYFIFIQDRAFQVIMKAMHPMMSTNFIEEMFERLTTAYVVFQP